MQTPSNSPNPLSEIEVAQLEGLIRRTNSSAAICGAGSIAVLPATARYWTLSTAAFGTIRKT
jgi:hypothetical protein